jgi:hypothetical protein
MTRRQAAAMQLSFGLASKLASVVVHASEMLDPVSGHEFDRIALEQAIRDPEVKRWISDLGPMAPVPRRKS